MPNKLVAVKECDARDDESSNAAQYKKEKEKISLPSAYTMLAAFIQTNLYR